jgi:hypothetical protein
MAITLRLAAIVFCLAQFFAIESLARVKVPDYGHLDRKGEAGKPGDGTGVERPGTGEPESAKPKQGCDDAIGANLASAAAPWSELRLESMPRSGELLSLLAGVDSSDIVRAAEGVSADGARCLLYVSITNDRGEQTFWRFAPDDEPAGWFDEWGRRLEPALAQPKPGSRISSPFGPRRYYGRLSGGGLHDGIDYESRVGEPIYAAADGVIEHQGGYFEYGLTVKIRHANQFASLYAHLSRFAGGLAVGSKVAKGQLIGFVGMSGRSTGAHLHFSTIVNGRFVDPAPYLSVNGHRPMSEPALAAFRQWQFDVRAAIERVRDRQRPHHIEDIEWTTRT